MRALFLQDGKWWGNEFPEEPSKRGPMSRQEFFTEYYEDELPAYHKAIANAKSEALEVINPEAYGFFKHENEWFLDSPLTDVRPIVDGILYPWDGEVEIVEQFLNGDGKHWLDWNGRQMSLYGCKGRRKVLRLIPKSPVPSQYLEGTEFTGTFTSESNSPVIPEGSKVSGIAAIGIPDFEKFSLLEDHDTIATPHTVMPEQHSVPMNVHKAVLLRELENKRLFKAGKDGIVREIAGIAWKGAANAFRMYPNNSHTFTAYWDAAKGQFERFTEPSPQAESDEQVAIDMLTMYKAFDNEESIEDVKAEFSQLWQSKRLETCHWIQTIGRYLTRKP